MPRVLRLGALRLPTDPPKVRRVDPALPVCSGESYPPTRPMCGMGPTNCRNWSEPRCADGRLTGRERAADWYRRRRAVTSAPRMGLVAAAAALAIAVSRDAGQRLRRRRRPPPIAGPNAPVTSTTRIAGAGVLGNQRRPDESCAPEPAPLDGARDPRRRSVTPRARPRCAAIRNASWCCRATSSTRCARWVCSRASWRPHLPDGSDQPAVLPRHRRARRARPRARAAHPTWAPSAPPAPDLILGSQGLTPQGYAALTAIAPTVFTGPPGAAWQDTLRTVGDGDGSRRRRQPAARRFRRGRRQDRRAERRHPFPGLGRAASPRTRCGCTAPTTSPAACSPRSAWIVLRRNGSPTSPISRSAPPT